MQVMPGPARYVAARLGLRNYRAKDVTDRADVTLGTAYMWLVMEQLGHPVLAAAAQRGPVARAAGAIRARWKARSTWNRFRFPRRATTCER